MAIREELIKAQADYIIQQIAEGFIAPRKMGEAQKPVRVPFTRLHETVEAMENEEETLP